MTPLIEYGLKANLFLCLFFGLYWLLLRRYTFFQLNRGYLLGTLVASFGLPFVAIPGLSSKWLWPTNVPQVVPTIMADGGYVVDLAQQTDAPSINWVDLATTAYLLIALVLLVRVVWRMGRLLYPLRQWPSERHPDFILVSAPHANVPTFSFFRYLVLNPADADSIPVRAHELTHIRQGHSVDLLLMDLAHALCWANPILFGYRRSLRKLHEFLADRSAMQTTSSPNEYARLLLQYAFNVSDGPAHSFGATQPNSPTLKQRIQMLYTPHTSRRVRWHYLLTLPLATGLLALTTPPPAATPTPEVRSDVELIAKPLPDAPTPTSQDTSRVYTVVDKTPQFSGGGAALFAYLGQNIRYPKEAIRRNVQGKVFVNFVVEADGSISRAKVLKGIGAGCDAEALRVVRQMPKWIPGKQNGKPVAVLYNLPIAFQLSEKGNKVGKRRLPILPQLSPNTLEFSHPLSTTLNGIPQRPGFRLDTTRLQPLSIYNSSIRSYTFDPLFVLNGSEITRDELITLEPNTIESINVLKGPGQVPIYGEKAKYGVVFIKTKVK